jgi:hypothetical protein
MGTAFEASGIEVNHHAADFAAGGRTGGHGIGREGPNRSARRAWETAGAAARRLRSPCRAKPPGHGAGTPRDQPIRQLNPVAEATGGSAM